MNIKNKDNDDIKQSLCPQCDSLIDTAISVEDESVIMTKTCKDHGTFKELLALDSERFFDKTYDVPGKSVHTYYGTSEKGCPHDCGFCSDHKQHICTGLIEITGRCNLQCPICYAHSLDREDITFQEFKKRLETLLEAERDELEVLQISGGEPLVHPEFIEFLKYAYTKKIKRILINTNGLVILEDKELLNTLIDMKDKVEIYLQFDGFNEDAILKLRGKNLLDQKRALIEMLDVNEIKITLAVTIFKDNIGEIHGILNHALEIKNISGITFQRLALVGAAENDDFNTVIQDDIIAALAETDYFNKEDIVPLPCSHPQCTSLAFLLSHDGEAHSVSNFVNYSEHKDILSNKVAFDEAILEYAKKNISCCTIGDIFMNNKKGFEAFKQFFMQSRQSTYNNMKILRVMIKNFMDHTTFDTDRIKKCCIGVSTGDEKIIPFCVYNNISRKNV